MVGWHHPRNGLEFGWALGAGDAQGGLTCCSPWVANSWTWLSDWTELTDHLNYLCFILTFTAWLSRLPFSMFHELPIYIHTHTYIHIYMHTYILHTCQKIWKTQQWPQDWKRSVFIPIPRKSNAKECSNYCTIALISHTSKVMLKILQAMLQQYVNHELPNVQAGFRKGRGTIDQIASI